MPSTDLLQVLRLERGRLQLRAEVGDLLVEALDDALEREQLLALGLALAVSLLRLAEDTLGADLGVGKGEHGSGEGKKEGRAQDH